MNEDVLMNDQTHSRPFLYNYRARVRRVIDADTVELDIDLGCYTWLMKETCRLYRINAWEKRGPERDKGLKAARRLEKLLSMRDVADGEDLIHIRTHKDKHGKYGRLLVELMRSDGKCLNDLLVEEGHARYQDY